MLEILREPDTVDNTELNTPKMDNDILPSSIVVSSDENLSCDLPKEAVVLNLKSGTYFGLNALGKRIWDLIQKPAKVSDVLQQLLSEYDVNPAKCEAELSSFLKQLHANNLITVQKTEEE
jgi:hypothetical protein